MHWRKKQSHDLTIIHRLLKINCMIKMITLDKKTSFLGIKTKKPLPTQIYWVCRFRRGQVLTAWLAILLTSWGRSLTHIKKREGSRTELWGNPALMKFLKRLPIQNYWYMKLAKAWKKLYLTKLIKDFEWTTEKDLQHSSFVATDLSLIFSNTWTICDFPTIKKTRFFQTWKKKFQPIVLS